MRTVEGSSSVVDASRAAVLRWFSGRAQARAEEALDLLADCEAAGCWLSGASRKVMGALSKTNVAEKMMRANSWIATSGDYTQAALGRWGHNLERLMKYGLWAEGRLIDFDWFEGENAKNFQTYLYLRNGDRVSRIRTEVDFGEKLFPDAETSIFRRGKLYAVMSVGSIERLATEGEYLDLLRREEEKRLEAEKLPEEDVFRRFGFMTTESDDWVPWDEGSVYYDDVTEYVQKAMSDHNRGGTDTRRATTC